MVAISGLAKSFRIPASASPAWVNALHYVSHWHISALETGFMRLQFTLLPQGCGQTRQAALRRRKPLARGLAIPWGSAGQPVTAPRFFMGPFSVSGAFRAWRHPAAFEQA